MRQVNHLLASLGAIVLGFSAASQAQTPAFPGALGFGANATGGRFGTVYHVTTLADSGPGSFRDAVSHGNRIVVFDVGGYIKLLSAVSVQGNITIAGQTAPGGGIGFRGGEISFASRNNIICRYIRVLPGSETTTWEDDSLSLYRATNVICDHVSLEFGPYNNLDAVSDDWQNYPVTAITFQNCIIADPSDYVAGDSHPGQQFGAHTECVNGTWSWFYNLFANSHNRNPLAKINTVFVNNVDYNCDAGYTTHTSTEFSHDLVKNYFIAGPAGSGNFPWFQIDTNQSFYLSGNLYDSDMNGALGGGITTPTFYQGGSGTILTAPWSSLTTNVPTYSPATTYRIVVSQAGALPRAPVDELVISQLRTLGNGPVGTGVGTAGPDGSLYHSQLNTGLANNGYGSINGGVAPLDSDGDGMPDYCERAVGLNPLSNDGMTIAADGYANIEHYLNWLADPHALTVTNTAVDVDLWQYTGGFTNASPVYSADNASNGSVALNGDGHTVHFVPTTDFAGLGSFRFSVTVPGSAYTNTVNVLMTPVTQPSSLFWRGDGVSNLWSVGSGTNWFDGTNFVAFNISDNVTFDDTGSNTPAINLSGFLPAGTINVVAAQDYTFGGTGSLSGLASLFKVGSGSLFINTLNTFSGGVTINEGIVQLGDGVSANGSLAGNVTNNDTLIFNNPGTVSAAMNLSGPGTLMKNGAGALTLSGIQTYTGPTTVNAGSLTLSGTLPPSDITDNSSVTLTVSAPQNYSHTLSGPGSLTASSSSLLTLSGANSYTGGTTNSAGNLFLANHNALGTGPLVYNGGYVFVGSNSVVTNDFAVPSSTADLMMAGTNNNVGTWAGNVVNLGTGAQWRPGSDGGTLIFTGDAELGAHYFIVPRGSVQFASNAAVSSTITACALGRDTSGGNRSASVTIRDTARLTLGGCSQGGGKPGKWVMVTLQDNAVLSVGAANYDLNNVSASGILTTNRLNGGTFIVGGLVKSANGNTMFFNGGVLQAGANNTAFLPVMSSQSNYVQAGGAIIDDGGFAITIAAPLLHDPLLGASFDGGLAKLGAGTLTLTASNTFTGDTLVVAGSLALSGNGSLPGTQNITVGSGATLDVSGRNDGTLTIVHNGFPGQTLRGQGTIIGNVVVQNLLAPGLPTGTYIGTLSFNNDLALGGGTEMDITKSPLTNDVIRVAGALTFGGVLAVAQLDGNPLGIGDSFKLFDAPGHSGAFLQVVLPPLASGLEWNTNALYSMGVISVVPASPVFGSGVTATGSNLSFQASGGISNGLFYLLYATNLAPANWTPRLTNQFDGNGDFNFTVDPDPNSPQGFYRLQLP